MRRSLPFLVLIILLAILLPRGGTPPIDAVSGATEDVKDADKEKTPEEIYADAFSRADAAGRLVFIVYWEKATSGNHKRAKSILLTRSRKSPQAAFIITSLEASKDDEIYTAYASDIGGDLPYWVLVKPGGGDPVASGNYGTVGPKGKGTWRDTLIEAAREHPPISKAERPKIAKLLAKTEEQFEAEEYDKVDVAMKNLRRVWFPNELAEPCQELWTNFEAVVAEWTDPVDALIGEEQFLEAAIGYQEVLDRLSERGEIGGGIEDTIKLLLKKHPEIRENFRRHQRGEPLVEAPTDDDAGDDSAGDDGPADDADDEADDDDAGDPQPDAEPDPADDEANAASLVSLAKQYHNKGMTKIALGKLNDCIKDYPNTQAAAEAQRLLDTWAGAADLE